MASSNLPTKHIELIPWDYDSAEHMDRMYLQRLTCGWRYDEVPLWKDLSRKGTKALFWIVLREGLSHRDELIAKHLGRYPKEAKPLKDTASEAWGLPREASGTSFMPIGHLALEVRPDQDKRIGLLPTEGKAEAGEPQQEGMNAVPTTPAVWICHLYISWALQNAGLGKKVMAEAERLMAAPPLDGKVAVLDTMAKHSQLDPTLVKALYLDRGNLAPQKSNQEWYERMGYVVFFQEKGAYLWTHPDSGESRALDVIYLKKELR